MGRHVINYELYIEISISITPSWRLYVIELFVTSEREPGLSSVQYLTFRNYVLWIANVLLYSCQHQAEEGMFFSPANRFHVSPKYWRFRSHGIEPCQIQNTRLRWASRLHSRYCQGDHPRLRTRCSPRQGRFPRSIPLQAPEGDVRSPGYPILPSMV